uniref:FHL1/2/3/5 N-terminal LIM domain-containing protein n=1 Tax=Sinocyclocheilus grahami TaxID=75366 RepID=A0A672K749_SINGR
MTERYDCHYCKESLFGKKYVLREENPYCVKCYESLYSNTCEECKKPIGCNSRVTSLNPYAVPYMKLHKTSQSD